MRKQKNLKLYGNHKDEFTGKNVKKTQYNFKHNYTLIILK